MNDNGDRRAKLLRKIDDTWSEFTDSYAGLPDHRLTEPGVTGTWSVKDIIGHVTTWEEEALKNLPIVVAGKRPPRYASYGGLDAFNAQMSAQKLDWPLFKIRWQQEETHRRLLDYLRSVPEEQLAGDNRFRRRLRLDTYGHYPLHAAAIREWRERLPE